MSLVPIDRETGKPKDPKNYTGEEKRDLKYAKEREDKVAAARAAKK
jgi:hypothetical protein